VFVHATSPTGTQIASSDSGGSAPILFTATTTTTSIRFDIPNSQTRIIDDVQVFEANTDGSIDSTVKANPDYGFSIVKWVGDGTSQGATVGHSLGVTPSMIFVKSTDSTAGWNVWHEGLTNATTSRLVLNDDSDEFDSVYVWGSTAPDNSAFGVGTVGGSTWTNRLDRNYIAYCFAEVAGYSYIGSYTTDGSTTTVTTGFKPAFVIFKRTNADGDWYIIDNTRFTSDDNNNLYLEPNTSGAEGDAATNNLDFTDTGFVINSSGSAFNPSNGEYCFMAFKDTREAAFWKDVSGQGNHWTPNNLDYRDSLPDSPANNFAVMNNLETNDSGATYTEGNLVFQTQSSGSNVGVASFSIPKSSKWYWEVNVLSTSGTISDNARIGLQVGSNITPSLDVRYKSNGDKSVNNASSAYGASYAAGDIIGVAVDADSNTVEFYKNGSSQGSISYTMDADSDYFPVLPEASGTINIKFAINFGQDSTFSGAKPMGAFTDANSIGNFQYDPGSYLALCTANLPEPSIIAGSDHFKTVLYTGDNADRNIDAGFKSDFVWIKQRSSPVSHHRLYDSVRGDGQTLFSSLTNAEADGVDDGVEFTYADGFNIDAGANVEYYNGSGRTYASWNWKAGGTAVLNEVGTIDSQVSANTTAGFSIATYTEPSGSFSFGHGLGVQPDMFIFKRRDGTENWIVWHKDFGAPTNNGLYLNSANAEFSSGSNWLTAIDSDTISITSGQVGSAGTKVCYSFANTDGYLKAGSYTGNNSSDGPFVFTGFRPAFVLVKKSSGTGKWVLMDTSRGLYNVMSGTNALYPHLSVEEGNDPNNREMDFLSNGFKVRNAGGDANGSGATIIYLAIASTPFKFSPAR